MSNIINKVKDAVTPGQKSTTTTQSAPEGTYGPHGSRTTNAADPRVDSDRDHRAAPGTTAGSHPHTSSGNYGQSTTTGSHNAGPHGTTGNKLDPRIDSDRDGRYAGNTAGDSHGSGREGVAGPHNSRVANAADPRVDSDRDGSRTVGNTYGSSGTATGATGTGGTHGSYPTSGSTTTGSHGTYGNDGTHGTTHGTHGVREGEAGPHGSRAANAADPRVDSDRDHRAAGNTYGSGTTGTHGSGITGTHGKGSTGTHGSGTTGTAGAHGTGIHGSGPGPASSTAGPHKSNLANKLDPRVDSDRDGSKTLGKDKTYAS